MNKKKILFYTISIIAAATLCFGCGSSASEDDIEQIDNTDSTNSSESTYNDWKANSYKNALSGYGSNGNSQNTDEEDKEYDTSYALEDGTICLLPNFGKCTDFQNAFSISQNDDSSSLLVSESSYAANKKSIQLIEEEYSDYTESSFTVNGKKGYVFTDVDSGGSSVYAVVDTGNSNYMEVSGNILSDKTSSSDVSKLVKNVFQHTAGYSTFDFKTKSGNTVSINYNSHKQSVTQDLYAHTSDASVTYSSASKQDVASLTRSTLGAAYSTVTLDDGKSTAYYNKNSNTICVSQNVGSSSNLYIEISPNQSFERTEENIKAIAQEYIAEQ